MTTKDTPTNESDKQQKRWRLKSPRRLDLFSLVGVVGAVVIVGVLVVLLVRAAGVFLAFEPENGVLSGPATVGTDSAASAGKYLQFNAPGSQPFPPVSHGSELTASNTGVPAGHTLTTVSSVLTVDDNWITTQNGGSRIISDKLFPSNSGLIINTNNVTVQFCKFVGKGGASSSQALAFGGGHTGNVIQYSEFDGQNLSVGDTPTIGGNGYTLLRDNMHNWMRNVFITDGPITIIETYMHDLNNDGSGGHQENIYVAGGTQLSFIRSKFIANGTGAISAALAIYNESYASFTPLDHIIIKDNYLAANGSYSLYAGDLSNKTGAFAKNEAVTGNIFGRELHRYSGIYGPYASFDPSQPGNVWSNNTWGPLGPFNQAGDPAPGTVIP